MFGFPFITSIVVAMASVSVASLVTNRGLSKADEDTDTLVSNEL